MMNGSGVRFWSNAWAGDLGPLRFLASCPLFEELNIKVGDMLKNDEGWDWDRFKDKVPCLV